MSINDLRYDQVAFKGVHNSIDRGYSVVAQLSGTKGVVGRCAALELDIHQASDEWTWEVKHGKHDPPVPFRDVLSEIAGWSKDNPKHSVVTIHIDLKNDPMSHATFAEKLDALLTDVFGKKRIYAPGSVIGDEPDLVRGARKGGWAKLRDLEGKFVFCLSGRVKRKLTYARTNPKARLCFTDFAGSRGPSKKGHQVFANLFVDAQKYRTSLAALAGTSGFITRGYNIVTKRNWDRSIAGGLNILSTDVLDKESYSLGRTGRRALAVRR